MLEFAAVGSMELGCVISVPYGNLLGHFGGSFPSLAGAGLAVAAFIYKNSFLSECASQQKSFLSQNFNNAWGPNFKHPNMTSANGCFLDELN